MGQKTTKTKSIKSLKAKAWKLFSEYIRRKDADANGIAKCVTCGHEEHWKQMQAGHFIPGRCNSILFEESGVHVQCARCNYNEGNGPEYYPFMLKTYGQAEIDRLRALRHKTVKLSIGFYESFIGELKQKLAELGS